MIQTNRAFLQVQIWLYDSQKVCLFLWRGVTRRQFFSCWKLSFPVKNIEVGCFLQLKPQAILRFSAFQTEQQIKTEENKIWENYIWRRAPFSSKICVYLIRNNADFFAAPEEQKDFLATLHFVGRERNQLPLLLLEQFYNGQLQILMLCLM